MCQRDRVAALHPDTGAPSHLRGAQLTKKIESTVQPIIGLDLRSTACSVFDCDEYIERKLLAFATRTRLRQGDEWLFIDLSVMEESKTYSGSFRTVISWSLKCARGMCEETGGCTANDGGFEPRCTCCDACPLLTDFSPYLTVTTQHRRGDDGGAFAEWTCPRYECSRCWPTKTMCARCGFQRGPSGAGGTANGKWVSPPSFATRRLPRLPRLLH